MKPPELICDRDGKPVVNLSALADLLSPCPPMPEGFALDLPGEALPLSVFERGLVWAAKTDDGGRARRFIERRYDLLVAQVGRSPDAFADTFRNYRPSDDVAFVLRWDELGPAARKLFRIYSKEIEKAFASCRA